MPSPFQTLCLIISNSLISIVLVPTMAENLYSVISNCSESSKQKMRQFLEQLFPSKQQQKQESHKLQSLFLRVTNGFSINRIRQISKNQRSKKDLTNYQFNYGEITFKTIYEIIGKARKHRVFGQNQIFYDLGSGSGKVLFAASLCYPFSKCIGIEYLQSLHSTSLQLREQIHKQTHSIEEEVNDILPQSYSLPHIEIHHQNFENFDWSNGTVIFVSSTCYTRDVMSTISNLCSQLKAGTVLITLTRPIDTKQKWKVADKFQGETSWGACTVFIHIRQP